MYRQNATRLGMLIHFAEHIGDGEVEGCIHELEQMGATVEQKGERTFSVKVLRRSKYPFVVQFLEQEERRGVLRFEADK